MNKRNRMLAGFLAACLLLHLPIAMAQDDAKTDTVTEPAVQDTTETTQLTLMGLEQDGSERVWAESAFFARMADITGVSFAMDQYTDSDAYQAALDAAFAPGGTLPDVLFKANLTPDEEMAYAKSGQLIDLAPLLSEHAPNISAMLEARPDFLAAISQPDGTIASLPAISGLQRQCALWINKTWLNALDLPMPTTIDAYTDVLRAFRDRDPNGNGKNDEVPLSMVGPFEAKFLLHAFGIVANDYNIYARDGAVHYAPLDPAYRDYVAWLHMALEEGLIEKNAFRQTHSARSSMVSTDKDAPQTVGGLVSIAPYTVVDMDQTRDYAVIPPLAHNGEQVYRKLFGSVGRGTFAITSACADVPAALRFADYLFTEEGGRLAFAGLEGEDYAFNADGKGWAWSNVQDQYALSGTVVQNIIAGDFLTPGLEPAAFMRNSEIVADNHARLQVDALSPHLVEPYPLTWPLDAADEARIAELQDVLGPLVDTAIANFAMGKVPLDDASWEAFQQSLRDGGALELVALLEKKLQAQSER